MVNYHPEEYWSEVALRIKSRKGKNIIAGDDEPFYRYKRKKFLRLLETIDFSNKTVLEVGCGPGGNLRYIWKTSPKRLVGADISEEMIQLSREKLPEDIELFKINGIKLPFKDYEFDYVFTATVLQHNTNEKMLRELMSEICRVCGDKVILFERIEKRIKGDKLCYGRPISFYKKLCEQQGFNLKTVRFINVRVSYFISGAIRKLLNPTLRQEGEPLSKFAVMLQKITLPVTRQLDSLFKSKKDVAKLEFERNRKI